MAPEELGAGRLAWPAGTQGAAARVARTGATARVARKTEETWLVAMVVAWAVARTKEVQRRKKVKAEGMEEAASMGKRAASKVGAMMAGAWEMEKAASRVAAGAMLARLVPKVGVGAAGM